MTNANDIQHGGAHYKGKPIQHWDWTETNGMGNMEYCCSKYVSRHRNKNGSEDLKKAKHYLQKLIELHHSLGRVNLVESINISAKLFCKMHELGANESEICRICLKWSTVDELEFAITLIDDLIVEYENEINTEHQNDARLNPHQFAGAMDMLFGGGGNDKDRRGERYAVIDEAEECPGYKLRNTEAGNGGVEVAKTVANDVTTIVNIENFYTMLESD